MGTIKILLFNKVYNEVIHEGKLAHIFPSEITMFEKITGNSLHIALKNKVHSPRGVEKETIRISNNNKILSLFHLIFILILTWSL
jgi:hypothetical protein